MPESESRPGRAWRFLMGAAAFVVVVAGMKAADTILIPFLVSLFTAVLCGPPVFWLHRKGLPQWLAMILVVAAIMGIGFGMAAVVGNSINRFTLELPSYQARLQELTLSTIQWLDEQGIQVTGRVVQDVANPGAIMALVGRLASGLGALVANTFLILLTVVFMLVEASGFPLKLRTALGETTAVKLPDFGRFADSIQDYLVIKTWISLATGAAAALWVAVLGVDFPVLWGLLAFLLNYVPNIGSIIAAVPPVLLAILQHDPQRALLVAAGYVALNVVFGSILEPRVMGTGVGLSTLVVFLSLVFWGWVLGPVGMLLSIPLTMAVKILLETSDDTRWVAILLGPSHLEEGRAKDNASPDDSTKTPAPPAVGDAEAPGGDTAPR
jgi:predicted PurR-regulated permease PerM